MIPQAVDYYKASSVANAQKVLVDNPDAKLLAGGHSLVPAMKLRLNSPTLVVDISGLAELQNITENNGSIYIGAMVTHGQIERSKLLQGKIKILVDTASKIGDTQIRNMGTIGGSIAHADPAADWPATLIACHAQIDIQAASGKRKLPAAEFFTGFFSTALEDGEIIVGIEIPIPEKEMGMAYQKFSQPASRFAIVGCAACILSTNGVIQKASIAFNGVGDAPYRAKAVEEALIGKNLNAEAIEAAAELATADASDILSDNFASEAYRSHLAKVFAKRAIKLAIGL